uniref:LRRcap domain-containing protein n=1 Tax=Macrostomum lignano TaxID=282301 RepID=A0A1I8I5L8_9PLAT
MSQSRVPQCSPRRVAEQTSAEPASSSAQGDFASDESHQETPTSAAMQEQQQKLSAGVGVRYITDALVLRVARQQDPVTVTAVNLSGRSDERKIRFIENLDRLKNLQSLNLSYNIIEKMEHLEKLTRLRELNLSHNRIARIDCLESLTQLQVLNLSGNLIGSLPAALGRRLKCLRTLLLSDNQIDSHSRPYILFCLPGLAKLDGRPVSPAERADADTRFRQDEADRLRAQLEEAEFSADELRAQLLTYEEEVGALSEQVDAALEQQAEGEQEREELLQQLRLKDG